MEEYREEASTLLESLPKSSPARLRLEIELLSAQALPFEKSASEALCSFEFVQVDDIVAGLSQVIDQAEQLLKRANNRLNRPRTLWFDQAVKSNAPVCQNLVGFRKSVRTRSALLAGWARTFRVLLDASVDPAQDRAAGLESFAWILAGEPTLPDVTEVPEAWITRRDVAFAIHGVCTISCWTP